MRQFYLGASVVVGLLAIGVAGMAASNGQWPLVIINMVIAAINLAWIVPTLHGRKGP